MLIVSENKALPKLLRDSVERLLKNQHFVPFPSVYFSLSQSIEEASVLEARSSVDICLLDLSVGNPARIEHFCHTLRRRQRIPVAVVFPGCETGEGDQLGDIPRIYALSSDIFTQPQKLDREFSQLLHAVHERRLLLDDLSREQSFEQLLKKIALRCACVTPLLAQRELSSVLEDVAEILGANGAAVWIYNDDGSMLATHSSAIRDELDASYRQSIRAKNLPSFLAEVRSQGFAQIRDTESFNEELETDCREFRRQHMRSVTGTGFKMQEGLAGLLLVHSAKPVLTWSYSEEIFLREVSEVLGHALVRLDRETQLAEHAEELESAVRDAEAKFQNVIESLMEGIVICDTKGVIKYSNYRLTQITGALRSEIEGKKVSDIYYPEKIRKRFTEAEEEYQEFSGRMQRRYDERRKGQAEQYEVRIFNEDGQERWLETKAGPLRDNLGEIVGSIGVIADVTEQRSLEEQLRWSQKMEAVGRLAGGVAHDFNNLLTVISGYAGMVLASLDTGAKQYRRVEAIKEATEAACTLTQQLLTVSRKQVVQPKVLNLNETLEHTIGIIRGLLGDEIELRTNLAPSLPSIRIDPGQIQQVIMNLAINARDAMREGGTLRLWTNTQFIAAGDYCIGARLDPAEYVVLTVSDTGSGMSETVKSHLFEPFFTTKKGGTGLGLSTIYGIVKQAGGDIAVSSEPGIGTKFTIFFPATFEEIVELGTDVTTARGQGNGTVLLVEDEEHVRILVREVLQEAGYTIIEAVHGGEALEHYAKHGESIDLILSDISMPHLNGVELTEKVLSKHPSQKILLMSGCTQDSAMPASIVRMNVPFLPKPFGPETLADKVAEVLDFQERENQGVA